MGHAAIDALPPLSAAPPKAPLADVFKPKYLRLTLLLVFAYFAHITSFYYILKWVAPIVSELGYSPYTIADVLFWASVGGATGGAILGLLSLRMSLIWLTSGVLVMGMISISVFGMGQDSLAGPQGHRRRLWILHECRYRRPVHTAGAGLSNASARYRHRRGHRRGARRRGASAYTGRAISSARDFRCRPCP